MFSFGHRPNVGTAPSASQSVFADHATLPRLRWMNFNTCPHCLANGRPSIIERLKDWGLIISRSDGVNFHLVLGDRPIEYPVQRPAHKTEMVSAGFWYVHEANGGLTESVVVILRRPRRRGIFLLCDLERIADKLADKLRTSSCLPCVFEFDGRQLHEIS